MKQNQYTEMDDDMREEYDFANMKGGIRGKYTKEFENNAINVLLDSDMAEVFPDSQSVN